MQHLIIQVYKSMYLYSLYIYNLISENIR